MHDSLDQESRATTIYSTVAYIFMIYSTLHKYLNILQLYDLRFWLY